jgi:hypothetical protein
MLDSKTRHLIMQEVLFLIRILEAPILYRSYGEFLALFVGGRPQVSLRALFQA